MKDGNRSSEPGANAPALPFETATQRGDRRWNRALGLGLIVAVLVHLAVLLSTRTSWVPSPPFAAAGPQAADSRAAAGGGGMEVVRVRVQEVRVEPEEPTPIPVPEVPPVDIEVPPEPDPAPVEIPALASTTPGTGDVGEGPEVGEATGPGLATGTGRGGGGADEEGASGMIAPTPRGMILPPPDRPRSVRGREVTVWVFVTESGRVLADSTRLEPPTPDAGYNRRLRQSAAEWSFEPARRTGRAIAAWYPYEIEL